MGDQSPPKAPHSAREEHSRDTSGPSLVSPLTDYRPDVVDRQRRAADATVHNDSVTERPRRFLALPIETTSRSSQASRRSSPDRTKKPGDEPHRPINQEAKDHRPRGRFLPEPIETTRASIRGPASTASTLEQNAQAGPRRFKPEVIETDRRSVRGKTVDLSLRSKVRVAAANELDSGTEESHAGSRLNSKRTPLSESLESKFSYASLLRRQEGRRHSFRVPELPSIPSNSSDDSDGSSKSLSILPSPRSAQPLSGNQRSANLFRESCDGEFSEYLLSLAAQSAQNQLKEQALAAFPNEQVYEPVDHFAIDEDEMDWEQDSVYPQAHHIKSRRQSSADLSWELEYLRQHKEDAQMRVRAMVAPRNPHITSAGRMTAPKSNLASPPMLGDDIVLPQSSSPEGTMCDNANGESGAHATSDACSGCGGLWCATSHPEGGRGAGLWMGTCRKADDGHARDSHVLTGIMTPMPQGEERDPFSEIFKNPAGSADQMSRQRASGVSSSSKALEDEFHDGFVTQIYNYLSLGYPCVARYYDYELSKISGIGVEELRRDDQQTDARGYVVPPDDDFGVPCMRWKALRLYIREWARQQPFMVEDESGLEAWGMPERKGSWAI